MIYRIEHKESGLGPFEHGNQEVLGKGISMSCKHFPDIDTIPEVKKLLNQYKGIALFGFNSLEACRSVIIDEVVMEQHGFVIREYNKISYYRNESGTVIFLKDTRSTYIPRDIPYLFMKKSMPRYEVVEESVSSHGCFDATIIDINIDGSYNEQSICECSDIAMAEKIADLLNKADITEKNAE